MNKRFFIIFFMTLTLIFTGCTNNKITKNKENKQVTENIYNSMIIGTWKSISDSNIMFIFYDDNSCKSGIYDKKTNKRYLSSCNYELKDNIITLKSGDEIEKYEIDSKNNNLIFITEAKTKIILKKSKNKDN